MKKKFTLDSFPDAKRCWFITDIHLGVRNNSQEWQDIQREYFVNWFFPLMQEHWMPGDVLMVLGDVFDSRQAINLKVLSLGVDIFEKLSELFPDGIVVILGNHDVFGKVSNDVNSLKALKYIPNVYIYEDPCVIDVGGTNFLLMPWRKDHDTERECLVDNAGKADYLLCHTDINGLKFNKHVDVSDGCKVSEYAGFKRVYSGHIHYSQKVENISMLGSPYQLTRSDAYNKKGVTLLELNTGKETYWENTFSPQFLKFNFTDILQITPAIAKALFANNMVDIIIDGEKALKAPLNLLMELVDGSPRAIFFHPVNNQEESTVVIDDAHFDIMVFVQKYVDGMPYEADVRQKVYDSIKKLHQMAGEQNSQPV